MYHKNTDQLPADTDLRLSAKDRDEAGFYTWEKKIDVVTKYMALGNMRLVSEITKIPYVTLGTWKKAPWWAQMVDEIKKTRSAETSSKLGKIVDKALVVIEDRLENGDFIWNQKESVMERKPVSMKDANTVAKDLLAHQIRVEEVSNRIETQKETVQDQLKMLANEFAKWSRKLVHTNATDVPFKEISSAIHEERETGLQEGGGSLYEQTLGSEEEDRAEQSP